MSTVRYVTADELEAMNADIIARHPWIAGIRERCCTGCTWAEIGREHGYPAADAWREYDGNRWLLGGTVQSHRKTMEGGCRSPR